MPVICSTSNLRIVSGSRSACAVTLETTGTTGILMVAFLSASSITFAAGDMSAQ